MVRIWDIASQQVLNQWSILLSDGDAGLRLGEIRALRPEHWNRRGARITVQRSLWQDIETATRGWKRRTIPLTERLQKALEALGDGRTYMVSDHPSAPLTSRPR